MRKRRREEEGAAVAAGMALIGLLVSFAVVGAHVAALVAAHRAAQGGADLAALAGATAARSGVDACREAARVAGRNRAQLRTCTLDGSTVLVEVVVRRTGILGRTHELAARARAGPGFSPGSNRRVELR